jgi:hypothetical protein
VINKIKVDIDFINIDLDFINARLLYCMRMGTGDVGIAVSAWAYTPEQRDAVILVLLRQRT